MKFKKIFMVMIAFVALAGIVHCVLVEPVVCRKDNAVAQAGMEEGSGCFVCNALHHQWISPALLDNVFGLQLSEKFMPMRARPDLDLLVRPIFHVPLVHF